MTGILIVAVVVFVLPEQIEKFAVHILSDAALTQRLSLKERNFAQQ